jgi:hypothetical protein
VLVYCPVFETFSRENLSGEIRKVVLPSALVREYMAAAHIQSGHAGIANLAARTRRNVFCLEEKAFTRIAREVCEECEGCSRTKSGPDHRSRFGPIPLPAERGQSIGVDITLGCADAQESTGLPKVPFVLSVTCRRVGYTELRVIPNGSAEAVASAFHNMLHTMGIAGTVREVWTDNGKQFVSAAFEALLRSVVPGVRHRLFPPYAGGYYEIPHRTLNQTLRAILATTPAQYWQKLCDFAM